jgi:hypothetical protein
MQLEAVVMAQIGAEYLERARVSLEGDDPGLGPPGPPPKSREAHIRATIDDGWLLAIKGKVIGLGEEYLLILRDEGRAVEEKERRVEESGRSLDA